MVVRPMSLEDDFVPVMRPDLLQRQVGDEVVVWSPIRGEPVALDPVASVMLRVVDGTATIAELVEDVEAVVGVPREVARSQVARCIAQMDRAGMLVSSSPTPSTSRAIFMSPISSCIETASCTGRVTPVSVEVAGHPIRVACGTRRVARRLRSSLSLPTAPDDAPLGFVVKAQRRGLDGYQLVDRGGFTLGTARRVDEAVDMVGSHLAALLPVGAGRVRLRVRALLREDRAVLCLFPLLFAPPPDEAHLEELGWRLLDRLVVDVDVDTGAVVADPAPWAVLRAMSPALGHAGRLERPASVAGLLVPQPDGAAARPSRAQLVATLGAEAVSGERADVLTTAARLVSGCPVDQVTLGAPSGLEAALGRLEGAPH